MSEQVSSTLTGRGGGQSIDVMSDPALPPLPPLNLPTEPEELRKLLIRFRYRPEALEEWIRLLARLNALEAGDTPIELPTDRSTWRQLVRQGSSDPFTDIVLLAAVQRLHLKDAEVV